jgi:hypothetical protein
LSLTPLLLGVISVAPPSEKPSAIAPSTAPANASPEDCASILVTETCSARSRTLSGGICTVWVSVGDVLPTKPAEPP